MDIIRDSVEKIRAVLDHGGCTDGDVLLAVDPDATTCQFEKGACMTASFGGRSAEFVTFDPVRARTKIAYMYDAPLDTPPVRGAAAAIVNVVTGFFCLSRVLHACPATCHAPCREELKREIGGKRIWCIGDVPEIEHLFRGLIVSDPGPADIILIGGDGLIAPGTGDLIAQYATTKRVLGIGPSVAGVSRIRMLEHWCPYGRSS